MRKLCEAEEGSVIVNERRGGPVAPARMPANKKSRIFDSMREIWTRMPQAGDSAKSIEEDRER
ncbi:MAG: hypothetical protein HYZ37_11610 [Candidatus Solibacter usitatus]|nr:hypothetical protein [Candidatus Solibacter usitatus]